MDRNAENLKLIQFIRDYPEMLTTARVAKEVLHMNLWGEFIRAFDIYSVLIDEHNEAFENGYIA